MIKPGTLLKTTQLLRGAVTSLTIEGGVNGNIINFDIPIGTVAEVIRDNGNRLFVWIPEYEIFVDQLPYTWYSE